MRSRKSLVKDVERRVLRPRTLHVGPWGKDRPKRELSKSVILCDYPLTVHPFLLLDKEGRRKDETRCKDRHRDLNLFVSRQVVGDKESRSRLLDSIGIKENTKFPNGPRMSTIGTHGVVGPTKRIRTGVETFRKVIQEKETWYTQRKRKDGTRTEL